MKKGQFGFIMVTLTGIYFHVVQSPDIFTIVTAGIYMFGWIIYTIKNLQDVFS